MERVRFDCPVCRKAFMVPLERASNRMCAACSAVSESHEKESPEPVLFAAEVPQDVTGFSEEFETGSDGDVWEEPSSQLQPPVTHNEKHDGGTIQKPQTAFVPVAEYKTLSWFAELIFAAGILCFAGAGLSLLVAGFGLVTFGKESEIIQAGLAAIGFAIAGCAVCAVSSFLKLCVTVAGDIRFMAQSQAAKNTK